MGKDPSLTPRELKDARHGLGLSADRFAATVGVADGRTVRRYEAGDRAIPGPLETLLHLADEVPQARAWLLNRASVEWRRLTRATETPRPKDRGSVPYA